jgi:hypothetical protein
MNTLGNAAAIRFVETPTIMLTGLAHTHSLLRWILLILLVYAVFRALSAGGKRYFEKDRKTALVVLILSHLQLLLGLGLYFGKSYHTMLTASDVMKNAFMRFWAVEHLTGMLLAIALITIGYGKIKRGTDDAGKWKAQRLFYTIALIIILLMIPWPFRGPEFEAYGWF